MSARCYKYTHRGRTRGVVQRTRKRFNTDNHSRESLRKFVVVRFQENGGQKKEKR